MMRVLPVALATLFFSVACQSYVLEPVQPTLYEGYSETVPLPPPAADILFVIDDSASMAGEQANLSRSFRTFVDTLEAENLAREAADLPAVHYRIAVTSTSVDQRYLSSGGTISESSTFAIPTGRDCQSAYAWSSGQDYPAGDFLSASNGPVILDSARLPSAELLQQLEENVQVGVCGSGQEQGLRAAELALLKHPDFGRRAKLVVIFLSDEEDCSDPAGAVFVEAPPVDNCVAEAALPGGGALASISSLVDLLRERSRDVVVGAIVSATGRCQDLGCEAACGGGGDPSGSPCWCGGQSTGSRYLELADAIAGDSLSDSICLDDFSSTLRQVAEAVVDVEWIELPGPPSEGNPALITVSITRPGEEIRCTSPTASLQDDASQSCAANPQLDWEYDAEQVALRLCRHPGSDCQIASGDTFRVSMVVGVCTEADPC